MVKARAKPKAAAGHVLAEKLPVGEVLCDLQKKKWIIGKPIGSGGFGLIYLAEEENKNIDDNARYVIKVEPQNNGPLFTEIAFYMRGAKKDDIDSWAKRHKEPYVGIPPYISHGLQQDKKLRFLVMPRFGKDLHTLWKDSNQRFKRETVAKLAIKLITALEYMHDRGYVHADVKGANILLGHKDTEKIFLVDFGLVYRYSVDGEHRDYKADPKKAHDGTIEYTSSDAHLGANPARRSDMEILGYVLVHWLCGSLPWDKNLENKNLVRDKKQEAMKNIKKFISDTCKVPEMLEYMEHVAGLKYTDEPDYNKLRGIFQLVIKKSKSRKSRLDFGAPIASQSNTEESDEPVQKKARVSKPKKTATAAEKKASTGKLKRNTLDVASSENEKVKKPVKRNARSKTKKITTSESDAEVNIMDESIELLPRKNLRKNTKKTYNLNDSEESEETRSNNKRTSNQKKNPPLKSQKKQKAKSSSSQETMDDSVYSSSNKENSDANMVIESSPEENVSDNDEEYFDSVSPADESNSDVPVQPKAAKRSRYSMAPLHTKTVLTKDDVLTGKTYGKHKEFRRKLRKAVPKNDAVTQTTPSLRKTKSRLNK